MADLNELGITTEMADECVEYIKTISGVVLSHDQLFALLEDEDDLVDEVIEWGVDDTETSGRLAAALSEHLLDRSWPLYGDNADVDAFIADLRAAATAKGIKVEASV